MTGGFTVIYTTSLLTMETEHRANYFELEEDEGDVDIGSFGPVYDESKIFRPARRTLAYNLLVLAQPAPMIDEAALIAMQQQLAQQAAFAQIPNEVKRVRHSHNQ